MITTAVESSACTISRNEGPAAHGQCRLRRRNRWIVTLRTQRLHQFGNGEHLRSIRLINFQGTTSAASCLLRRSRCADANNADRIAWSLMQCMAQVRAIRSALLASGIERRSKQAGRRRSLPWKLMSRIDGELAIAELMESLRAEG